jgi:hypothetical protein
VLVRFITLVASRFGVVLTQKFAAQAQPLVGALGGASVNYVFIQHFQDMARGHFTVRKLERAYGKDIVRAEYEPLAQSLWTGGISDRPQETEVANRPVIGTSDSRPCISGNHVSETKVWTAHLTVRPDLKIGDREMLKKWVGSY